MGVAVRIDIDELVLHGVPPADRYRVAAAFERELTRLLRIHGLPGTPATPTTLPPLPPVTSPYRLGRALARSVHSGLSEPS